MWCWRRPNPSGAALWTPGPKSSAGVMIEGGAQVSGSRIVGPVVTVATGDRVLRRAVHRYRGECVIDDSEIEYSIVLPRASIRGVRRIEASIIGHEVGDRRAGTQGSPARSRRSQQGANKLMRILVTGGAS